MLSPGPHSMTWRDDACHRFMFAFFRTSLFTIHHIHHSQFPDTGRSFRRNAPRPIPFAHDTSPQQAKSTLIVLFQLLASGSWLLISCLLSAFPPSLSRAARLLSKSDPGGSTLTVGLLFLAASLDFDEASESPAGPAARIDYAGLEISSKVETTISMRV